MNNYYIALLEYYHTCDNYYKWNGIIPKHEIETINELLLVENNIKLINQSKFINISTNIINKSYRLTLIIDNIQSNGSYNCNISNINIHPSITSLDRLIHLSKVNELAINSLIDCTRLIKVIIKPSNNSNYNSIITNGIEFHNQTYEFFTTKEPLKCCYFIRIDRSNSIYPNTYSIRSKLFNIKSLTTISLVNMRLGLLLSNSTFGIYYNQYSNNQITVNVIDDISSSNTCLTDGSGFISYDLAQLLPNLVIQGQNLPNDLFIPSVYQVRIISLTNGLFKGTLVVNKYLPNHTITIRKSMLKVKPNDCCSKNNIDSTSLLLDIVNTNRPTNSYDNYLNKHLIINLHSLGVTIQTIQDLINDEIELLTTCLHNKSTAIQILNRSNSLHITNNQKSFDSRTNEGICNSLLTFGLPLNEPFIQSVLYQQMQLSISNLIDLRIPIYPMVYLIGIPDPLDILLPNEVFINTNNDIITNNMNILVTRFPLLNPFSISIYTNKLYDQLIDYFSNTIYDFIIFSTKVNKELDSPVDRMNGDYDGDLYCIIANQLIIHDIELYNQSTNHLIDLNECLSIEVINNVIDSYNNNLNYNFVSSNISNYQFNYKFISNYISNYLSTYLQNSNITNNITIHLPVSIHLNEANDLQVHEALFYDYIYLSHLPDYIAILANEWMVAAEIFGGKHVICTYVNILHQLVMNYRKQSISYIVKLIDYLNKRKSRKKYNELSNESKSLLGLLSDYISSCVNQIDINNYINQLDIQLDIKMKQNKANSFLQLTNQLIASYLNEINGLTRQIYQSNDKIDKQLDIRSSVLLSNNKQNINKRYQHIFIYLCIHVHQNWKSNQSESINDIGRYISSAIYEIAYLLGKNSCTDIKIKITTSLSNQLIKSNVKYLRIPWLICGEVLIDIYNYSHSYVYSLVDVTMQSNDMLLINQLMNLLDINEMKPAIVFTFHPLKSITT